jgi:hypothetical protein
VNPVEIVLISCNTIESRRSSKENQPLGKQTHHISRPK